MTKQNTGHPDMQWEALNTIAVEWSAGQANTQGQLEGGVSNVKWKPPDTNIKASDGAEVHWDLVRIISNRCRLSTLTLDISNLRDGPEQEALRHTHIC